MREYVNRLRKLVGNEPVILVGANVVILNDEKEVLLQQRVEPYGKWGLPGGLMELGEAPEETARREVFEETGLKVGELSLLTAVSGKESFVHLSNGDIFQAVTISYYTYEYSGTLTIDKEEGLDVKFFPINQLPQEMVGSHLEIINTYKEKIGDEENGF